MHARVYTGNHCVRLENTKREKEEREGGKEGKPVRLACMGVWDRLEKQARYNKMKIRSYGFPRIIGCVCCKPLHQVVDLLLLVVDGCFILVNDVVDVDHVFRLLQLSDELFCLPSQSGRVQRHGFLVHHEANQRPAKQGEEQEQEKKTLEVAFTSLVDRHHTRSLQRGKWRFAECLPKKRKISFVWLAFFFFFFFFFPCRHEFIVCDLMSIIACG